MIDNLPLSKILFLDIETVPVMPNFGELPAEMQKLWAKKASKIRNYEDAASEKTDEELFREKAAIFAEYGKIVCISVGIIAKPDNNDIQLRLKSFAGDDETQLLNDFADMLNKYFNTDKHLLCAHNGKEFDFPYIARRMMILGIKLPKILNLQGKKPWEIPHLDTMELWKFGDYKHYTSLELLAAVFNIPTPKDDIDGSMVGSVFWDDFDIDRIKTYCEKDVLTIVQLFLRFRRMPILEDHQIKTN